MSGKQEMKRIELENVNVTVEVSPNELKLWACSRETGVSVLRIKTLAQGIEVHRSPISNDILITKKVT